MGSLPLHMEAMEVLLECKSDGVACGIKLKLFHLTPKPFMTWSLFTFPALSLTLLPFALLPSSVGHL